MSKVKLPIVITPTRVELGQRCYRRHALTDVLSKAKYFSPSLEFGSVIHSGVSNIWLERKFGNQPNLMELIKKEWVDRFDMKGTSQESVSLDMAVAMLDFYGKNAKLAGPFDEPGYKLVDCEQRFEVPFSVDGQKAIISFQCDRVVFNEEKNHLIIVDTKTAARLDQRWEKQWEMSLQMKLYKLLAMEVFGIDNTDIVIEGLLKKVPSDIRYYVCPNWSRAQMGEAIFATQNVVRKDLNLVADVIPIRNSLDKVVPMLTTKPVDKVEEIAVAYTEFNYGECNSYNVECPFREICVSDINDRVGILRSPPYFELPEEEETY